MCFSTAAWVTNSDSAIPRFDFPSAIAANTSNCLGVRRSSGRSRRAAEHPRDDLGVEGGAAGGDPTDRVDERLDVSHPLLEQIADPLGAAGDQLLGEVVLVELRQHQDPGLGPLAPQLDRRAQAVVDVARRHPDVDDRDFRPVAQCPAEEVLGVPGLRHDLEAGLGEQPDDALAEEHIVLADNDRLWLRHKA